MRERGAQEPFHPPRVSRAPRTLCAPQKIAAILQAANKGVAVK